MADQVLSYFDNGQPATYSEAGTGKPYTIDTNPNSSTYKQKTYLSPMAAAAPQQATNVDPTKASLAPLEGPKGGIFKGQGQWDSTTGTWKQPTNWGNILAMGVGGAIAAPFVAGALGAGAGAGSTGAEVAAVPDSVLAGGPSTASLAGIDAGTFGGTAAGTTAAVAPEVAAAIPTTAAGALAGGAVAPTVFTSVDAAIAGGVSPTVAALTAAGVPSSLIATAVDNGTVQDPTPQLGHTAQNTAADTSGSPQTGPTSWSDLLKTGGQMLTKGAQSSANQDLLNNQSAASYLDALDKDYQTKLAASVNTPAVLQRQAMWNAGGQGAMNPDPTKSGQPLLNADQRALLAAQKAAIMGKLNTANAMPLPTAPTAPAYQQPGTGTNVASTLGTIGQVASQVPWSKIASYF